MQLPIKLVFFWKIKEYDFFKVSYYQLPEEGDVNEYGKLTSVITSRTAESAASESTFDIPVFAAKIVMISPFLTTGT
jgi:hypothetical protein